MVEPNERKPFPNLVVNQSQKQTDQILQVIENKTIFKQDKSFLFY